MIYAFCYTLPPIRRNCNKIRRIILPHETPCQECHSYFLVFDEQSLQFYISYYFLSERSSFTSVCWNLENLLLLMKLYAPAA